MIEPLAIAPFINSSSSEKKFVRILDTTLRDGEQTEGISFSSAEKLLLAQKLLSEVNVDFLEIASAKVSGTEQESCRAVFSWAKENNLLDRVEILSFVDGTKSVDWVSAAGGKVINLLCKGSEKHLEQLHKTPTEHFADIRDTISYAKSKGFMVNAYLEDFSNGAQHYIPYMERLIEVLAECGVQRVMLADTLGLLWPEKVKEVVGLLVKEFPRVSFDFHGHNDYGLAAANSLAAAQAGATTIHCTVNGLGERSGNAALEEVVPSLRDFFGIETNVNEKELFAVSRIVELFSKQRVAKNKPIVGPVVFTQTAGVHADGDKKGDLYKSKLSAERFGRKTRYALGKLSGKASVSMALREYGIELDEDSLKKVLSRVVELGDKKEYVTREDLLFILDEFTGNGHPKYFEVVSFDIHSSSKKKPSAKVVFSFNGTKISAKGSGDGGYDAFMSALKSVCSKKNIVLPELIDYEVRIPIGGKTDALVETRIVWKNDKTFETVGVSTDQVEAAIKSTEKMMNFLFLMGKRK